MRGIKRRSVCLAVVLLLAAGPSGAELPESYPGVFNELSLILDGDMVNPVVLARGAWLASNYFPAGPARLEFNGQRFQAAGTPGQAAISGLYLAVNGTETHHRQVRSSLESDPSKRFWMWQLFGTEDAFFSSLQESQAFRPLLGALPSTGGLRSQLQILIRSRDPLVRRAGLFWGYWLAGGDYWASVREMASGDSDPVNRACANRLIRLASTARP